MSRLTDDDKRFGPLTWGRSGWKNYSVVINSGGSDEGYQHNALVVYFLNWVFRLRLPNIIKPYSRWVDTSKYNWSTNPAGGYTETFPREYGFRLSDGHFMLYLGAQTHDSTTTQDWGCFLPWTQWRFVRYAIYNPDGSLFFERLGSNKGFDAQHAATEAVPKCVFEIEDYDGERIIATTHIEQREWLFGTKWCKFLSIFRKRMVRRSLDIRLSKELGPEKGSWKGGTVGTSIDMLDCETPAGAFVRWCGQEQKARHSQRYSVKFIRIIDQDPVETNP